MLPRRTLSVRVHDVIEHRLDGSLAVGAAVPRLRGLRRYRHEHRPRSSSRALPEREYRAQVREGLHVRHLLPVIEVVRLVSRRCRQQLRFYLLPGEFAFRQYRLRGDLIDGTEAVGREEVIRSKDMQPTEKRRQATGGVSVSEGGKEGTQHNTA